jgi:HEPN domain-containing protein
MRKDTANWIALTDYDLETAQHMLATGRYLYVVFLCHLALEKLLKAHVAEVTQSLPIKTHDLIYLLRRASWSCHSNTLISSVRSIQPVFLRVTRMICSGL